jgi:guanine deaminase
MDRHSPASYCESLEASMQSTKQLVAYCSQKGKQLVQPVVTPRFIPTCSDELLRQLGSFALQNDCRLQSHLSENTSECQWVEALHGGKSYTAAYGSVNCLNAKCIMAHAIHLTDDDIQMLKESNVGVAHCPNSNFNLMSGVMKTRKLLQSGLKVGLGTDCSGGHSSSMLDAIRSALCASKVVHLQDASSAPLTLPEAFYLATVGSAAVLSLDAVGRFEPDFLFDALLIDLEAPGTLLDFYDASDAYGMFEKFLMCGDDRNVISVYVGGQRVKPA